MKDSEGVLLKVRYAYQCRYASHGLPVREEIPEKNIFSDRKQLIIWHK